MKPHRDSVVHIRIIQDYIRRKRNWDKSDYTIVQKQKTDEMIVYCLNHFEDYDLKIVEENGKQTVTIGGGKSLVLYFDINKLEVLKVLGYQ